MKKLLALLACLSFAFVACDDSASASSGNGSGSNKSAKGSFPANGDSDFYCDVTNGTNSDGTTWVQMKVNIPNYMGHVEKLTYDQEGNGSQYYEESYFRITPMDKLEMCLEFQEFIQEEKEERNISDFYCDEGVSYFVTNFEHLKLEKILSRATYFEEDCEEYRTDWKEGVYDRYQR
ncbi:MAG: hypothetical protein IK012_08365 [Fibrobacter sp.]|uniref:hypothetical protein n=1 Tax=Fibrobacter sp. TaxID=35828 RepID=UPI0025C0FF04|nr:hypothetical protein [Fibrobacter sp.]MBR4785249.1 hypothetical protein [Fibrobacter sp.]